MNHDWVTKVQCSQCLGVQTPDTKDDDRCSGMVKSNRIEESYERARGIARREDGAIPKEALRHGVYYYGRCRNASIARWDATKQVFVHWRQKFGDVFLEEISCREDELHFDVFDPWFELQDSHAINTIKISDKPADYPPDDRIVPKPTS
jgi:hypothetical protein